MKQDTQPAKAHTPGPSMSQLREKAIFSGSHIGIPFEIHRRPNDGNSSNEWRFTFYLFLHESRMANFEAHWLAPKLTEPQWNHYDYMHIPAGIVDGWNGGLTYYRKHGEVPGLRCVELGCDFAHIWDEDRHVTLETVFLEAIQTINNLLEGGIILPKQPALAALPEGGK